MEATGREAEGSEDEVWPKLLGISCTSSATQSPPGWNHLQQLGLGVFRICLVHWGSDDSYCSKEEVRPFGIFPHIILFPETRASLNAFAENFVTDGHTESV